MSTPLNQAAQNPTPYPLSGGIKPTSPNFPAEMNPEIHRLQEEITRQQTMLAAQASELEITRALLAMKDQQLADYKEIIFTMLGKSAQKTL